ncbi:MAG TPA: cytochrome c [Caldilineaceae bacterium]|nr:cytochrome c [Caldilineaceae bacterium]
MRKPWYDWLFVRSSVLKITLGIATVLLTFAVLLAQFGFENKRMAAQADNWQGRSVEKGAEIFANNCFTCHGADGKGLPGVAPALHSKYFFTERLTDVGYAGTLHDYIAGTVASGRPSKAQRQWAQMMPTWSSRFGGPLRDDQVEQVVQFVLNWEEDALQQSWDPPSDNTDPWQPFQDAPSKATAGSITYTVGTLGVAAVTAEQVAGAIVTPTTSSEAGAGSTANLTPPQLFVNMGCAGCHKLGTVGVGVTGPDLNQLPEVAGTRVPGEDAATYVHNSIVTPNAHVVEGFQPNLMPQNFSERMNEDQIQQLVKWLLDPNRAYE